MRKLIVAAGFICVLISLLFYSDSKNKVAIIKTPIHSDCSLEKIPCEISLPNGLALLFNLEPKGLPVMDPLVLTINGLEFIEEPLKVWFEGKSMNMGIHYMLPSPISSRVPGEYIFNGMIPVCSIDKNMVWLLNVDVPIKSQVFNIQFQLKSILGD